MAPGHDDLEQMVHWLDTLSLVKSSEFRAKTKDALVELGSAREALLELVGLKERVIQQEAVIEALTQSMLALASQAPTVAEAVPVAGEAFSVGLAVHDVVFEPSVVPHPAHHTGKHFPTATTKHGTAEFAWVKLGKVSASGLGIMLMCSGKPTRWWPVSCLEWEPAAVVGEFTVRTDMRMAKQKGWL